MTGLVSRLLVPGLFAVEIWDEGQAIAVHPDEDRLVAGSADKRRRDFALGRACARAALAELGHGGAVIAKADDGAPSWPAGTVGSITHTRGYAAAVVGNVRDFAGLGIDAEQVGEVTQELWPRLFTSVELDRLKAHPHPLTAATLVFSAKESSYKAWRRKSPLVFREIQVTLEGDGFAANGPGGSLRGHFGIENGVALTLARYGG